MRISVCVGEYAKTPYCVPGLELNVFSMEELCYCMKENAFLLDASLLNDGLLNWIERECGLKELAGALYPLVHRQGSLSGFVTAILRYVGFYGADAVEETGQALKQGAGLSGIEKRKSQVDYLVKKKKYRSALKGYDELLQKWQETEEGKKAAGNCLAAIWHNKGVAYAGLMLYGKASECFREACGLEDREDYWLDYLAAKRMQLSEEDYVAFVGENGDWYRYSLELESRLERASEEWEQSPDFLRLYNRRELRNGVDRQKFYEDNDRLTQALKDSYRI